MIAASHNNNEPDLYIFFVAYKSAFLLSDILEIHNNSINFTNNVACFLIDPLQGNSQISPAETSKQAYTSGV